MILKNQVEWALHCCSILSGIPEGRYLATRDLAELHGIPKEYLSKALQALSQAGVVEATLGPTGGYRLAKPPSAITFLDIVEGVEGSRSTFACTEIRKNIPCRPAGTKDGKVCAIAQVMYGADEAWRAHLRAISLTDLLDQLKKDLPKPLTAAIQAWTEKRF